MFFFITISAQEDFSFRKNIVNANYYCATAKNFTENGVQVSYFRRSEIEENIHIEYGANIYFSGNKNPLIYIKHDSIYQTKTTGINFDFGIKMVKSKRIRENSIHIRERCVVKELRLCLRESEQRTLIS